MFSPRRHNYCIELEVNAAAWLLGASQASETAVKKSYSVRYGRLCLKYRKSVIKVSGKLEPPNQDRTTNDKYRIFLSLIFF